jgi:hypothetical protein
MDFSKLKILEVLPSALPVYCSFVTSFQYSSYSRNKERPQVMATLSSQVFADAEFDICRDKLLSAAVSF